MNLYNHYVYRWIDVYGKVIYVGETRRSLDKRLAEHFSCNPRCTNFKRKDISKVHKIEYLKFDNDYDAMEHERYYISLWNPRLNKAEKYSGAKQDDPNKRTDWKTKKVLRPLYKDSSEYQTKKLTPFENFIFGFITVASVLAVLLLYYK
ncbi:GIY-YIG nuclease family protein [Romboutsia sp.]|uniref:GIY-YIG nuclease family protein n=1 Tax=Romboutsia sp. TaxID=1965302 RepID=UPI002C2C8DCB|nr:GIY-YIG nuclease family protein [Romboutsia sp.]HSQ88702.1 GIY-YIG nuclease family protein [Romboutsia sp.]